MNAAIRFALTAAIALGFASMSFAAGDEAHWGYTGKEGANKWGDLKQEFATCKLGKENPALKTLWSNLPKEKEKETAVDKVNIDVATLLPRDRNYYTFAGSLTTPPCSESVTWFVLKSPVQASNAQFDAFGKLYAMNARPVQPLNGRVIRLSN